MNVSSRNGNLKPVPTRTLRQPMSLSVAESPVPGTQPAIREGPSDAVALRRALERRAEVQRRANRWLDKLMEETPDRHEFQKALSYIHKNQYAEVLHERHLNSLCSYPLCPNPPAAAYRSQKRFLVSTRTRTITESEGNLDEGFCSQRCRVRSAWVERRLGGEAAWLRNKAQPIELLEDLETRGEVAWEGRKGDRLVRKDTSSPPVSPDIKPPAVSSSVKAPILTVSSPSNVGGVNSQTIPSAPTSNIITAPDTPPAPVALPAPTAPPAPDRVKTVSQSTPTVVDLIASLTIHERPTPSNPPIPPSLSSSLHLEGPRSPVSQPREAEAVPLPLPQQATTHTLAPRRGPSSMLSVSTSKLATAVLAASKKIKPIMDEGDSDDSSASEEEWAQQMGWGEGDTRVEQLFQEARAARELATE